MESNRIQKNIETSRTKPNAQFHFVSENTLIWFQLRWKQQPSQSSTTSDNCAAAVCLCVCGWTTANTWAEARILVDGCLALPWPALPWLLIKCQIASISAGHMWRTPTHSNRNSYSYSSSTELYIWIIEFEFGIEWRRGSYYCCLACPQSSLNVCLPHSL